MKHKCPEFFAKKIWGMSEVIGWDVSNKAKGKIQTPTTEVSDKSGPGS
jgi:hypothetical protein